MALNITSRFHKANVLGVGIHALTMRDAVDAIASAVASRQKGYICVAGVHGVMEARRNPSLARVFRDAFLVVPDGMPTVWMGRLQGLSITRLFGPDLMLAVLQDERLAQVKHYLYGGCPGVAEQLKLQLTQWYPGLRVIGTFCPPFRPLSADEQSDLFHEIDCLRPDVIWVGLSTPKQEQFMADYISRLATTMMIGVGAAFDFHTGRIADSPPWIKKIGLQWLHRLAQDPRRLWRRYLLNNPSFIWNAILQVLQLKKFTLYPVEESNVASHRSCSAVVPPL
jgi:N-acetylglucosaminyldiphosphoundecaprenol N-acetyl-beta-D-mannosaminyltransferase